MASAGSIIDAASFTAGLLRQIDDDRTRLMAEGLEMWLAGAEFEAALGLAGGWRAMVRDRARGDALARLVKLLPAASDRATATEAATLIARYASSAWGADRRAGRRPPGLKGAMFDLLQVSEPPSSETIRRVLRRRNGSPGGVSLTHAATDAAEHEAPDAA